MPKALDGVEEEGPGGGFGEGGSKSEEVGSSHGWVGVEQTEKRRTKKCWGVWNGREEKRRDGLVGAKFVIGVGTCLLEEAADRHVLTRQSTTSLFSTSPDNSEGSFG